MKKMMKIAAMLLVVVTATNAVAQELPQPSPAAKVEQRIGLTDVTVEYSRPSVKGREIFGGLVPYDKIWRTGANENTLITFTDDVKINGDVLSAGTYSIFTIPYANEMAWKVVFNSVIDGWGEGKYDEANNVLEAKVMIATITKQESMLFSFDNLTANSGILTLAWDKVAISLSIEVEVEAKAWANIKKAMKGATDENKANIYRNAAKYAVSSNTHLENGFAWINESIDTKESWYSYWVKADVQHAMGDKKGAISSIKKAIKIGEAGAEESGKPFGYKEKLEAAIVKYKK